MDQLCSWQLASELWLWYRMLLREEQAILLWITLP